MRALSLHQPWAQLVASGAKRVETRSWSTPYRGPLAIHASKRMPAEAREFAHSGPVLGVLRTAGALDRGLPLGAVVAVCRLVAIEHIRCGCLSCVDRLLGGGTIDEVELEQSFGNFGVGRFAWALAEVRALREPVPGAGSLGLWEWEPPERLEVRA